MTRAYSTLHSRFVKLTVPLELVSGSHAVDIAKKVVVRHSSGQSHKPASS
ncbi:MAG TPA: hypothetical protein VGG79_07205 [Roseiarcus sp.]|jgi:hypothetical protein